MHLLWGFYLGFDWHPVLFFIALIISLVVVRWVGWPVVWLLPAFVLYAGLDWVIPDLWGLSLMFLFKLVFWIGVLVVLVTFFMPRDTIAKWPFSQMTGLIVFLLILMFFTWCFDAIGVIDSDGDEAPRPDISEPIDACKPPKGVPDTVETEGYQDAIPENYTVDSAGFCVKDEPIVTPPSTPFVCPPAYEQTLDPNWKNRFVSAGYEGTAEQKRLQMLAAARRDYRYLHFLGESLFDRQIIRQELVTADKDCLTERGRNLYTEVKGALLASGVRTGVAPATWYNTGMQNGTAVVSKTRGLRGDRKATIYTLRNGTKLVVLDRCGNMALPSKPRGMPPGKTDNPSKPPREYGGDNPPTLSKTESDEPAQQGNVPTNVQGRNPGTNNGSATSPEAKPPATYTPPPAPTSSGSGTRDNPPPPPESNTPSEDPAPTQDPCSSNPDFC